MLTKALTSALIAALSNEKVQQFIRDALGKLVTERIVPLIPVAVSAAVKAVVDQIPGVNMSGDVKEVANEVRDVLNRIIPDIDLPLIGDLTDFWRPKG